MGSWNSEETGLGREDRDREIERQRDRPKTEAGT